MLMGTVCAFSGRFSAVTMTVESVAGEGAWELASSCATAARTDTSADVVINAVGSTTAAALLVNLDVLIALPPVAGSRARLQFQVRGHTSPRASYCWTASGLQCISGIDNVIYFF